MGLLEDRVRELARPSLDKVDSLWNSCTKPPADYAASIKAKINVSGPKPVAIFDESGKEAALPNPWERQAANAVVSVRGVYSQRTGCGLLLDVTHLNIRSCGDELQVASPLAT